MYLFRRERWSALTTRPNRLSWNYKQSLKVKVDSPLGLSCSLLLLTHCEHKWLFEKVGFRDCILICHSSKHAAFTSAPVEPGKFDLVYQNPDGTERVEYAVNRDARVSLHRYLLQNDLIHLTKHALTKKKKKNWRQLFPLRISRGKSLRIVRDQNDVTCSQMEGCTTYM